MKATNLFDYVDYVDEPLQKLYFQHCNSVEQWVWNSGYPSGVEGKYMVW